jgi:hypothetical protein
MPPYCARALEGKVAGGAIFQDPDQIRPALKLASLPQRVSKVFTVVGMLAANS